MKVWLVGTQFYRMHRKFGYCWAECRDPINLMDRPSNMQIGLRWYQKGTNNKRTYNYVDHLMVFLKTIIVLDSMTYIIANVNAYECHRRDEKVFIDFIDKCYDFTLYI